jgi:flagellar hook assembly protein FlgD
MDRKRLMATMIAAASLVSFFGVKPAVSTQEILRLVSNYPNPFDSRSECTTIAYTLAADSMVTVKIYDLFGKLVREFPSMQEGAGLNQVAWDGTDDDNRKVAKGGYICVIEIISAEMQLVMSRKIGVIH